MWGLGILLSPSALMAQEEPAQPWSCSLCVWSVFGEVEGACVDVPSLKAAPWLHVCLTGLSLGRGLCFER